MEIKIPKEIKKYTECIFMGLTLKQCIMSGIAIALAAPIFIALRPKLGLELASWVCIIIVAPIAATAFIKIKNLPLFEYVIAFVKWFFTKNPLVSQPKNIYMDAVTQTRMGKVKTKRKQPKEVYYESDEADC